jgi:hypothetical protein
LPGEIVLGKALMRSPGRYVYTVCPDCNAGRWVPLRKIKRRKSLLCKVCTGKRRFGAGTPNWNGDRATRKTGHQRAQRRFPVLGKCQRCGLKDARERHHKDGNTLNNEPGNVDKLCYSCHRIVEPRNKKPLRNCSNCGILTNRLTHGRCKNCYMYFYRHGKEKVNVKQTA